MASPAGREPDRGTEYELKSKNRLEAVAVPSTLRQHTPSAHCTSPRRSSALRRQGKIAAKMDAHEYYCHWILCRDLKEKFSRTMKKDRNSTFVGGLKKFGNFQ